MFLKYSSDVSNSYIYSSYNVSNAIWQEDHKNYVNSEFMSEFEYEYLVINKLNTNRRHLVPLWYKSKGMGSCAMA